MVTRILMHHVELPTRNSSDSERVPSVASSSGVLLHREFGSQDAFLRMDSSAFAIEPYGPDSDEPIGDPFGSPRNRIPNPDARCTERSTAWRTTDSSPITTTRSDARVTAV